jgi:xanthine dehydrogenase molybdenum-binding subunit
VYKVIGKNVSRLDGIEKVTGRAKYAADFFERKMLVGKVLRSPHAHAIVKSIDVSEAKTLPGVEAVLTYKDVPQTPYSTCGHPYSLDPEHRDITDRHILTKKARFAGDPVAAVVAVDELTAKKALEMIKVEYEVLGFSLTPEEAIRPGAPVIHDEFPNNILADFGYQIRDVEKALAESAYVFEDEYETSIIHHGHIETNVSYAYMDSWERIVIVSSTQIPFLTRRLVAQALGLPSNKVRVIKPYVGGGFGNKQDALQEPLNALMTMAVGGKPVMLEYSREECMIDTRTRYAFKYKSKISISKEGKILARDISALANGGAYASHGHAIALCAGHLFRYLYNFEAISFKPKTVYTNLPAAGAMRGYGVPQIIFAIECQMDDVARRLNIDPIDFRIKNLNQVGYCDPLTGMTITSNGIVECIEIGRKRIQWDKKKEEYNNQKGSKRRGLGIACFSFTSGAYPASVEVGGARIILNEDGSLQLQVGATEIGQGSDTVFAQMAAEAVGVPMKMVYVTSTQDTDISPYDSGAYATRQTYVAGSAVVKAAYEIKKKILSLVSKIKNVPENMLEVTEGKVVLKHSNKLVMSLEDVALHSYYDKAHAAPITSDVTVNRKVNGPCFGVTFAEVEVDMETGKVEVIEIINAHDSGTIINRQTAEGQVHGGVSMAIGYALYEQMLFDEKAGKPLNNNLLDYKLPTIMDIPEILVDFVEPEDPTGPFGSKGLGEPPAVSPAAAIRNAILDATGIAFNKLPITPQRVFERLKLEGLIK